MKRVALYIVSLLVLMGLAYKANDYLWQRAWRQESAAAQKQSNAIANLSLQQQNQSTIQVATALRQQKKMGQHHYFARLLADGALDPSFEVSAFSSSQRSNYHPLQENASVLVFALYGYLAKADPLDSMVSSQGLIWLNAEGKPEIGHDTLRITINNNGLVATQSDGRVFLANVVQFGTKNLRPDLNLPLVRLMPGGDLDDTFSIDSALHLRGTISSLSVDAEDRLLLAGNFQSGEVEHALPLYFLRFMPDGKKDPSFLSGSGFDGPVTTVVPEKDGSILVAGKFKKYRGVAVGPLVRLKPDGLLDVSFSVAPEDFNLANHAVFSQESGEVYLVDLLNNTAPPGSIVSNIVDSQARNYQYPTVRVRKFFPTGRRDELFSGAAAMEHFRPCRGENPFVGVQADNKVIVSLHAQHCDEAARANIIRLEPDGKMDSTFKLATGEILPASPWVVGIYPDGKLLVAYWRDN